MRLLTHNTLKNNSSAAKGKGFPLKINATDMRVDDNNHNMEDDIQIGFVRKILPTLDWSALVQGASEMGIPTLPPVLTEELSEDDEFCKALYHILMNVHLVEGTLICPVTGRVFPVQNEIPNFIISEEECEQNR